jgi:hypothetical protein
VNFHSPSTGGAGNGGQADSMSILLRDRIESTFAERMTAKNPFNAPI